MTPTTHPSALVQQNPPHDNACSWLASPTIDLGPEGAFVVFDSYNDVECFHDGWNLQISLDDGDSWLPIIL